VPATTRPAIEALAGRLTPVQIRSIAGSDGQINLWDGAIRSGKTKGSLLKWLLYVRQAPPGELIMVAKTVQAAHRNLWVPLMDPKEFGRDIASSVHYTSGAPTGTIFGRRVHVVGANDAKAEAKIRGFTSAGAYVDEATLVPHDFWRTLLGRLSAPGAKLFATTNPDSPAHWLRKEVILADDPAVRHFHFKITDNTFLPAEYVSMIKSQYSGLYYRRFIDGEWVAAEGAVYDMWDDDRHLIDVLPAISQWIAVGIDYGTSNPFHAVLLGLGADGVLYAASEYRYDGRKASRQKTDSEYLTAVQDWLVKPKGVRLPGTPKAYIVDPSAASFRTELMTARLPQFPGDNSVLDGIRTVSNLLGKDKLKVSRVGCPELVREISSYAWDDKAALLGEDKPIKVEDHGVDALRYAVHTTRSIWLPHVKIPLAA
jgi:PBSX family phage terminase large subunit